MRMMQIIHPCFLWKPLLSRGISHQRDEDCIPHKCKDLMETTKGGILGQHTLKDTDDDDDDDDVKVEERKQHEHDDGRDDEMEP
ncbi:hypothetical protein NQZ68_000427 [Dissostichus eleginoides]|nr:hypothetical protein NQZ68_000427 [Dissostichus eleginoides]